MEVLPQFFMTSLIVYLGQCHPRNAAHNQHTTIAVASMETW